MGLVPREILTIVDTYTKKLPTRSAIDRIVFDIRHYRIRRSTNRGPFQCAVRCDVPIIAQL